MSIYYPPSLLELWNPHLPRFTGFPIVSPDTDFYETTDDSLIVGFKVPGLDKEDIKITAEGSSVVIVADWSVLGKEYQLRKRLKFPGVDTEKTVAKLVHGVLTITIPKNESKMKKIQVK